MSADQEFHPIANIWPLLPEDELQELADDIVENGMHYAIWRHRDGRIIDGRNRWLACQKARVECPANTYTGDDGAELVAFVVSLNEKRRHLSESQRAMVAAKIATLEQGRPSADKAANLPVSQQQAAEIMHVGERSVRDAKAVQRTGSPELVQAVERGKVAVSTAATIARAPVERQREVVARGRDEILREAGKIREERARENAAKRAEVASRQAVLPTAGYGCIVIDPPWPMKKIDRDVRPNQVGFDYPTMSEEEMATLSLPTAEDCHLFCWTTHKFLPMALRLIERWGFRYVCTFVWHKSGGFQPIGLPQYNCEFALYGRKGSPTFIDTKAFPTCFQAPRGAHSEKPQEFYDVVRRVVAGPCLDMFNRRNIEGFDGWGNESGGISGAA